MNNEFLQEHFAETRRHFLTRGIVFSAVAAHASHQAISYADNSPSKPKTPRRADNAGARAEPYFTPQTEFRDVSRGNPLPHTLSEEKKRQVGMTRETWKLEVIADVEHQATIGNPMTAANGTALDFEGLTVNALKGDRERCLNAGMDEYVSKVGRLRRSTGKAGHHSPAENPQASRSASPAILQHRSFHKVGFELVDEVDQPARTMDD